MVANHSHSSVGTILEDCSYAWYLEKVAGVRPRFSDHPRAAAGSAVHAALEVHERARLDGVVVPEEQMVAHARESLKFADVDWERHDPAQALAEATASIRNFWHTPIPSGQLGSGMTPERLIAVWRPVAIERRFTVFRPRVTARAVVGSPDVVYHVPAVVDGQGIGPLVVVDWKCPLHFRSYPVDGSKHRLQGAAYARAVVEAPNLPGRKRMPWPTALFICLRGETSEHGAFQGVRVIQVRPTDDDMRIIDQRMRTADVRVADGEIAKAPETYLCQHGYCGHRYDLGGTCVPDDPPEQTIDVRGEPLPIVAVSSP